jgi:hypothetical protein
VAGNWHLAAGADRVVTLEETMYGRTVL